MWTGTISFLHKLLHVFFFFQYVIAYFCLHNRSDLTDHRGLPLIKRFLFRDGHEMNHKGKNNPMNLAVLSFCGSFWGNELVRGEKPALVICMCAMTQIFQIQWQKLCISISTPMIKAFKPMVWGHYRVFSLAAPRFWNALSEKTDCLSLILVLLFPGKEPPLQPVDSA